MILFWNSELFVEICVLSFLVKRKISGMRASSVLNWGES